MAVRGRDAGARAPLRWRAAGPLLAALLTASACAIPADRDDTLTTGALDATLERRAAAVLAHDRAGYLDALAPEAAKLRAAQRTELDRLADVPLKSWTYDVKDITEQDGQWATAEVELRYRIAGYDTAPVATRRVLELMRDGDRWYITADRPADGASGQLWQLGDVEVVKGDHSIVLGVGRGAEELRQIADTVDLAVPAVSEAWPRPWSGRVVVLVPDSVSSMAKLLGSPETSYRGIAAVTTGEAGGTGERPAIADRVVVNPQAYATLGSFGQRIVLTHETTHVATRTSTSAATPSGSPRGSPTGPPTGARTGPPRRSPPSWPTPSAAAGPREAPRRPGLRLRRRGGRAGRGVRGRLAGLRADRRAVGHGEADRLLRDRGRAPGARGAVEQAMKAVLATTLEQFTADWRDYLAARLG